MRISDWSSDVCSSELLLGVRGAGRSALRGEVVDDDADIAAIDPAEAGDFAVARRAGHVLLEDCRRAEQPDLQEAALVHQGGKPLLGVQLAALASLRKLGLTTHPAGALAPLVERGEQCLISHEQGSSCFWLPGRIDRKSTRLNSSN